MTHPLHPHQRINSLFVFGNPLINLLKRLHHNIQVCLGAHIVDCLSRNQSRCVRINTLISCCLNDCQPHQLIPAYKTFGLHLIPQSSIKSDAKSSVRHSSGILNEEAGYHRTTGEPVQITAKRVIKAKSLLKAA